MTSPHKKMMLALKAKNKERENYIKVESIPKGTKLPCYKFEIATCTQYDKEGKVITNPKEPKYTVIAKFKIGTLKYFTWLPSDYQNTEKAKMVEMAETLQGALDTNFNMYLVYYGKGGTRHELEIVDDDEEVDDKKLASCEQACSPAKRPRN